ncbi:hypothetical protein K2X05_06315, partial [bacterium]|nr:hypothetical protein [bacterium]
MALNVKYRSSIFFVFFLGLVSCSKDKEVVYQPLPVEAQNVGAMDSQQKMQWAKNITELELGGELVIDLLKK